MKAYKTVEYKGKKYNITRINATFTMIELKDLETDETIIITDGDIIDALIEYKPFKKLIFGADGYFWTEKDGRYDKKYELVLKEDGTVIAVEVKED